MKSFLSFFPIFAAAALLTSCSAVNRTAVMAASDMVKKGMPQIFSQCDAEYVKEAMPANLQLMELLLENDKSNRELSVSAAMGFCGYSLMFLDGEDNERASGFYLKGQKYAEAALAGKDRDDLNRNDVPALFWKTFCKASYMNLNRDKPAVIASLSELEPAIKKLMDLEPSYFYNGPYSLMGAYEAMRPKMFGGDPYKAMEYFDKALTGEGADFQFTRFMYAKTAAAEVMDAEKFENLLNSVINSEKKDDKICLLNTVARTKARKLLEIKDEIF